MEKHASGEEIQGRYELQREIGSGAFGEVWLARDSQAGRPVAIKFLKTSEAWALQRFEVEAAALARLDHPNCVTLLDFGNVAAGQPFIVTEFLSGATLADWMTSPRSVAEAVDVVRQIAEAVTHAHDRQVLHRDLKPANVWLITDPDGSIVVKVLDFGMARLTGSELADITQTGEVIGTPGFMSPEQLRAARDIGPPTDVYSLGVILFTLLEGRAPFVAETRLAVAMHHLTTPAPPITVAVPPGLAQLVSAMLSKQPGARPSMADALRVLRGEPMRSSPEEPTTRRRVDPRRPRRTLVVMVGVLGVLAMVWLALRESPRSETQRPSANGGVRSDSRLLIGGEPVSSRPEKVAASDVGILRDLGGSPGCGRPHQAGVDSVPGAAFPVAVRIPSAYEPTKPAPVLMLLHDLSQTPAQFLETEELMALADRDGFVVLAHTAGAAPAVPILGDLPIWGNWLAPADVSNVREDLERVAEEYCLDLDRVFIIGHGNGAVAADYVACQTPGVVALATTSHRLWGDRQLCDNGSVVPTIFLSPLEDVAAPLDGLNDCFGNDSKWSLQKHEQTLRDHHGCSGKPSRYPSGTGGKCKTSKCDVELVWCQVEGGRDWKSMPDRRALTGDAKTGLKTFCASTPGKFDYAMTIWEFFQHVEQTRDRGAVELTPAR